MTPEQRPLIVFPQWSVHANVVTKAPSGTLIACIIGRTKQIMVLVASYLFGPLVLHYAIPGRAVRGPPADETRQCIDQDTVTWLVQAIGRGNGRW